MVRLVSQNNEMQLHHNDKHIFLSMQKAIKSAHYTENI
jgi:hypothetical protein